MSDDRRSRILGMRDLIEGMSASDVATALYGINDHARWCKSRHRGQDGGDCDCQLRERRAENPAGDIHSEIRLDEDGQLDEVVAWGVRFFHLERMDLGAWWLRLDFPDGSAIVVNLSARRPGRTKVEGMAEREERAGRKV